MTPFEKDVDALIKEVRREGWEVLRSASNLKGAERAAAMAHANVKSAMADRLIRLMWQHGLGVAPAEDKKQTGARR
jgi:malate/lactate dehydrogenase